MLVFLLLSHLSLSGAVQSGIFGGGEAKPHSRPYMASLQIGRSHSCGGVLIREDFVLTAAHCLNSSVRLDSVVLGAHNIGKKEKSQQRIGISEFIPHPKYPKKKLSDDDPRAFHHDIMLLKLQTKAKLKKKKVEVLQLPDKVDEKIPAGVQCEVAGWGRRCFGKQAESVLYEAKVKLEQPAKCENKWEEYYDQAQMTCSVSDGKEGFCQGDSGGPLICGKGKAKILYGVTAYTGAPCDTPEYPEVYMRVPHFLPWIKNVLISNDALQTKT
ncbi:mast cell protease 1A-like isoform X3 [Alosa sapidissima]|uniref:mast cell protease 1A-like isoform X3 n=1 Tax=Alosa sapidissima TaxID=34773 RepID=UPI001C09FB36|nr:mast cell protease 1A-like isoform X3 [Alosa sapidissima]